MDNQETEREILERGKREGRIDATIENHTAHLTRINGSIDRFATELRTVVTEIRSLKEDARLAFERVKVAADTLATETERRREELALATGASERGISKRDKFIALAVTVVIAIVGFVITLYFR